MKIGILTLPLYTNYGGILQAYALQVVLKRLGHDARLIVCGQMRPGLYGKIRHHLSPIKMKIQECIVPDSFSKDLCQHTRRFIHKWISQDYFVSIDSISRNQYDAIVVGSDQIWRKKYVESSSYSKIENCFLDFAKDWNIKRISYAASFGTDEWEYSESLTKKCSELIQLFDAVSVREKAGVELCHKYLNHEAIHLLDPTMLLTKEDYRKLVRKRIMQRHGIMTYILDEDEKKSSIIRKVQTSTGMEVFKSNVSYNHIGAAKSRIAQPPVEHWIQAFDDADFIITDSFHACVFSILFNKPFIVIPNMERGASRFHSLLETFHQEHRIVGNDFELSDNILANPNCDIASYRDVSINFLQSNLQ